MYRSKLMKSIAVLATMAALTVTAATAEAKVLDSSRKPFFVTLDQGTKKVLARAGTLTIFAQCETDLWVDEEGEAEGGEDLVIKIVAKNSKGAWMKTDSERVLRSGQRTVLHSLSEDIEETAFEAEGDDIGAVVTRSGHFAAVEASLGLNILGHDCIAMGTVSSITGNP